MAVCGELFLVALRKEVYKLMIYQSLLKSKGEIIIGIQINYRFALTFLSLQSG